MTPLGQRRRTEPKVDVITTESDEEEVGWTLREALATTTFWLLSMSFFLGLMAAAAIHAHQVAFLQDAGLSLEAASTIAGVTLGMTMGGRFFIGWASERTQYLHWILSLCLVLQALGAGLLLYFEPLGFVALIGFVPLFGLGYGGLVVLWPLTVGADFGTRAFGAIAGMVGAVALSIGGAIGPVAAGALYDATGNYFLAFLLCAGALLVGAGAAFITTKPHKRERIAG